MDSAPLSDYLQLAIQAANQAQQAVLAIYKGNITVALKPDQSPVTLADQHAHQAIQAELAKSHLPIVSEEGSKVHNQGQDYFWLVDPLDGTKEFINKNDEFTINIALIYQNRPLLGVVAVPALGVTYFAVQGQGAYKYTDAQSDPIPIKLAPAVKPSDSALAVSRSHAKPADQSFIARNHIATVRPLGSALKYCQIATGEVHFTVRYTPLMEWDIAASDVVVREAGGILTDLAGNQFAYHGSFAPLDQGVFAGPKVLFQQLLF